MTASLLPSNASAAEQALALSLARLSDIPVPNRDLWNPRTIPAHLLPWLAWSLSIGEEWALATTEAERRSMVAAAVELHRYKGTPYAVRRGLVSAGFRDATVQEGQAVLRHDATVRRDGSDDYNVGRRWALFSVTLDLGNDKGFDPEVARLARIAIDVWKNARSHLRSLELRATLTENRTTTATASPRLRAGFALTSRRPGFRDGTHRRASPARDLHDGVRRYGDIASRTGAVQWVGLSFGTARITIRLDVGLGLEGRRVQGVWRDGSVRFSGAMRRGFADALEPQPRMLALRLDDTRGAWPEIPGFLVYPDPDAWAGGRPLDGPVYGSAMRSHPRDGTVLRDSTRRFGPDELTYYTQQGNTVLQTVWDYDHTQWDGNTTEWDD
ncbi:phage tail protein I [alpha proteobacterium BAL199]|nr:phage tail protein I [alpha proteobacterium BAL199]